MNRRFINEKYLVSDLCGGFPQTGPGHTLSAQLRVHLRRQRNRGHALQKSQSLQSLQAQAESAHGQDFLTSGSLYFTLWEEDPLSCRNFSNSQSQNSSSGRGRSSCTSSRENWKYLHSQWMGSNSALNSSGTRSNFLQAVSP